uniref:Gag-pol_0 protein n=1 Tax=Fopius arisanus TaxID=64838 RepID=A0A0C9RIM7_9HYME
MLLTEDRVLLGSLSKGGDACRAEWHPHKRFKVNLGTADTQAWVDSKWSPPHGLVWYTDGSKRCSPAGAGVWSNRPSVEKALGLGPHVTPLQTELAALRACARIILARQDKGKVIHIYSDSRRALRALLKHESGSRLVNDCIELMDKVATCNKLKVFWIPGHAGILGNEKADMLAKQGCQTMAPVEEDHVGVHSDYIKELIQKRADRGVVESWSSGMGTRHTRSLLREPSRKLADELVSLSRVKLRALLGLITGHWPLAAYLARIGKGDDPLCPRCGLMEEDPHHLSTKWS